MAPSIPAFLSASANRLMIFGGKGGVGKTTLAAATALFRAGQNPQKKILIASTDPAHSLGDSFTQVIGDKITAVENTPNLFALEMDAASRLDKFKLSYNPVLKKIMDRGTYFDEDDISQFFDLSLPGLDELMAVIEIAELVQTGEYDLVILDTAPTGHTLRMLALPQLMQRWIGVLDLMLQKHRFMVATFGKYHPDETDAFLLMMTDKLKQLQIVLTDPLATSFVPVMIPEIMSISETGRLIDELKRLQIQLNTIVVNHLLPESSCPFCTERRQAQENLLADPLNGIDILASKNTPASEVVYMPLLPHPVRGQADLLQIGRLLCGATPELLPAGAEHTADAIHKPTSAPSALVPTRLILFGGKGGVGKTTVSAATAMYLARQQSSASTAKGQGRVLLFSTDPAHSLSDSLAQSIGNKVTQVTGNPNLFAIEMDAKDLLDEFNALYVEEINEVFNSFLSGNFNIQFDKQVMEELITLTPPGIDELMALMKIMEFMDEDQFDYYVLDLAPTGHALRFLETPTLVRQWFVIFFKLLLKYQGIASLSKVSELLLQKSKQLRKVQQYLLDPLKSQFVTVTSAAAMAVFETKRLVKRLTALKIPCSLVVTNMLIPQNDCPFCAGTRAGQQTYVDEIDALLPASLHLNLFSSSVQGTEKLTQVLEQLYGDKNG